MLHENSKDRLTLFWAVSLGVLAVLYRLAPYYVLPANSSALWNLAPVGALALFVGSRLRTRDAYLIPLGCMLVSDLLLIGPLAAMGYPSLTWGTPINYVSFALYVAMGRLIASKDLAPQVIGGAALLGGVQFFVVTNFATWLTACGAETRLYPLTLEGLITCYAAAVPFFRNTVASDLLFSGLFFGLHAALVWTSTTLKARTA